VNKVNNLRVDYYMKIPKTYRGLHKLSSRATCGPRVWDPWSTSINFSICIWNRRGKLLLETRIQYKSV